MTDKATVELSAQLPGYLSNQYFKGSEITLKDKPLCDFETMDESQEKPDTLHLCCSFDHRVIDGNMAASFSHTLANLLQHPASLL